MTTRLTFGDSHTIELRGEEVTWLGANQQRFPRLENPDEAVRSALAAPLGFPPLTAATVPGDHVAIAIDAGVPQVDQIIRGVVAAMLDAHIAPALITVVAAEPISHLDELTGQLAAMGAGAVKFEVHNPSDEQASAMVGVNSRGEPLRLNRTLAEADLVLPVGVGKAPRTEDAELEKYGSLFPQFSTRETVERLHAQAVIESAKQRKRTIHEIDEAGWLLGVGMTLSVIPGAAGGVAAVLAGDPATVARTAADQTRAIWMPPAERQADLVIATVVGDRTEQTWHNLGRALNAAAELVEPGGAIALYSELDEPPGGSLNRLLDAVDFGEVQQELLHDQADDVAPALALAKALDSGPVYLRSRLAADVVEALGMTAIENEDELSRLVASRERCIVIEEAQRVMPQLAKREAP